MANTKVYRKGSTVMVEPLGGTKEYVNSYDIGIIGTKIHLTDLSPIRPQRFIIDFTELQDEGGNFVGPALADIEEYLSETVGTASTPSSVDVVLNDQFTPSFDLYFVKVLTFHTTSAITVIDSYDVTLSDATGFVVGDWVGIVGSGRYLWAEVLGVNANVITLDRSLDFVFPSGSNVLRSTRSMNVDGSVTPQVFSIQAGAAGLIVDITRIMWTIQCASKPSTGEFGDLPVLTRGVQLRIGNGKVINLLNFKSNFDLAEAAESFTILEEVSVPDVNAVGARTTWGGQEHRGVVLRLKAGDTLSIIIQDNLTGLIDFRALAQGHEIS